MNNLEKNAFVCHNIDEVMNVNSLLVEKGCRWIIYSDKDYSTSKPPKTVTSTNFKLNKVYILSTNNSIRYCIGYKNKTNFIDKNYNVTDASQLSRKGKVEQIINVEKK